MPLRVTRRSDTGALTISGTIDLSDGRKVRYRRRAQSDDPRLAREEAAAREAEILRTAWHGERRGARTFAEAALSYLGAWDEISQQPQFFPPPEFPLGAAEAVDSRAKRSAAAGVRRLPGDG